MKILRLIEILQDNNPDKEVYIETYIKGKEFTNNSNDVLYNRGILTGVCIDNNNIVLYSND